MLSFMTEQEPKVISQGRKEGDVPHEGEILTVAGRQKRVRHSTVFVIILFGIGLLALGLMVKQSRPKAAGAAPSAKEEQKIEDAISRLTGVKSEMQDGMDQIVKKFYEFSDVLQIGVSELTKNPFELESFMHPIAVQPAVVRADRVEEPPVPRVVAAAVVTPAPVAEPAPVPEKPKPDPVAVAQEQARRQAAQMRLQTVFQSGANRCCMVDEQVLREGDSFKGFRIGRIGDATVELVFDANDRIGLSPAIDIRMVLKLSD